MSLLSEVARTGRKFRRKSEPDTWYFLEGKYVCQVGLDPDGCTAVINAEMLTAMDWEAEPKKIEITSQDLMDCAKILSNNPITHQRRLAPTEFMKLVIAELGLDE